MTYVMSDLHGCKEAFQTILASINFSPTEDHLFIIGDVIDRGPEPIALLMQVMEMVKDGSATMLMGNHELWMLEYLLYGDPDTKREWYHNGGEVTMQAFRTLPQRDKLAIRTFLNGLPVSLEVTVNGQRFHLVHGYPARLFLDMVWSRMTSASVNPIPDAIAIVGHTPTVFVDPLQLEEGIKIIHRPGVIDIDCGSVCVTGGKLACLRLDDMHEFYVDC